MFHNDELLKIPKESKPRKPETTLTYPSGKQTGINLGSLENAGTISYVQECRLEQYLLADLFYIGQAVSNNVDISQPNICAVECRSMSPEPFKITTDSTPSSKIARRLLAGSSEPAASNYRFRDRENQNSDAIWQFPKLGHPNIVP